jgi:hypothetical protein
MGGKKELVVANWQRKAITVASKAIKAGQGQEAEATPIIL